MQSHRRGRDGRREGGRGGGRAEGIRRANGPIESTWGTVRKCSRKVYKHNTLGQGRGRCCSSSHCNNSLPQKSIFRRGTAEAHAIHQGAKIALGQHRAPMRPQRQKRLAAFSGHRHKFVGQGQSVSHIRARRRASTRVFSGIALRATKRGGGKESITGKRHARGPRLAVLQDGSARLNVAQQREQSPRPGRPARRSASSIFSLCLSFLPSASPGASPNVGPSNEAKRHNGREAVAEKQTQTDTGSRARACTCTCTEAWRKKKGEKRKETVGNQWESAPRKCR